MQFQLKPDEARDEDVAWLVLMLQDRLVRIGDAAHIAQCRRLLRALGAEPLIQENDYEWRLRMAKNKPAVPATPPIKPRVAVRKVEPSAGRIGVSGGQQAV